MGRSAPTLLVEFANENREHRPCYSYQAEQPEAIEKGHYVSLLLHDGSNPSDATRSRVSSRVPVIDEALCNLTKTVGKASIKIRDVRDEH